MTTAALDGPAAWTDKKRWLWMLGFTVMFLPLTGVQLAEATGWSLFYWFAPLFIYTAIPALDLLIGTDASNPPESAVAGLEADKYYRYIVYVAVPVDFPQSLIPDELGLIVADAYGGEVLRHPPRRPVAAARRKALLIVCARLASERLARIDDPDFGDMV